MIFYALAIALVITVSIALGTWLAPPPSDKDVTPERLQQGGGWSDLPDDPEDDG